MVKFSQCAWLKIKDYWGVYNIKSINYTLFKLFNDPEYNSVALYIIHSYIKLGLHLSSPYYMNIRCSSVPIETRIQLICKSLAEGYKSKPFYERLNNINTAIPSTNTLESSTILSKYEEDPDLFKWLHYKGFRLKLRGRYKRLVFVNPDNTRFVINV